MAKFLFKLTKIESPLSYKCCHSCVSHACKLATSEVIKRFQPHWKFINSISDWNYEDAESEIVHSIKLLYS